MKTFQDLTAAGELETARMEFVQKAVSEHRQSAKYQIASAAEAYYAKRNLTIEKYQKLLRKMDGTTVPDFFSANYKLKTLFFRRFVIQQTQYVLSNGVDFEGEKTKAQLGTRFDNAIQKLAKKAMVDHVSFGFWNKDHLEVFCFADTPKDPGFAPLYDDDTGALMAGIRYWYPDDETERYTLYEVDGYTEYKKTGEKPCAVMEKKQSYIKNSTKAPADPEAVVSGRNYEGRLPIIPMYANDLHESEIVGIRESIDCYDFIKSGFANAIDESSDFYWVLKNTGGMDDVDLARFVERMKTVRAATVDADEGAGAEAHTMEIPTEAREKMLTILKNDLYEDFQILNTSALAAGEKTATEIRTAYQPMDDKCGDFEYCIRDFIDQLLDLVGIQDNYSFRWNRIGNQTEETQMVMTAYAVLGDELTLKKLPFLTPEEATARIKELTAEDSSRVKTEPPKEE